MVLFSSRNGSIIRYIDYIYSKTEANLFLLISLSNGLNLHSSFPEMYNLLLTICLLYIFIEEFSQVDVFLREKIEQVTLVCIKGSI